MNRIRCFILRNSSISIHRSQGSCSAVSSFSRPLATLCPLRRSAAGPPSVRPISRILQHETPDPFYVRPQLQRFELEHRLHSDRAHRLHSAHRILRLFPAKTASGASWLAGNNLKMRSPPLPPFTARRLIHPLFTELSGVLDAIRRLPLRLLNSVGRMRPYGHSPPISPSAKFA